MMKNNPVTPIGNEMVKWRPRSRLTLLRLWIGNGRAPFHVCGGRKPAPELRFTVTAVEREVTVLMVGGLALGSSDLVTRSGRPSPLTSMRSKSVAFWLWVE